MSKMSKEDMAALIAFQCAIDGREPTLDEIDMCSALPSNHSLMNIDKSLFTKIREWFYL